MKYNYVFDEATQKTVLVIQEGQNESRIPVDDLLFTMADIQGQKKAHGDGLPPPKPVPAQ